MTHDYIKAWLMEWGWKEEELTEDVMKYFQWLFKVEKEREVLYARMRESHCLSGNRFK